MLCNRGGPKLEVGGACTSVAVDLGDLEGRCPDLLNLWTERERNLTEIIDWQTFKLSADQVHMSSLSLSLSPSLPPS